MAAQAALALLSCTSLVARHPPPLLHAPRYAPLVAITGSVAPEEAEAAVERAEALAAQALTAREEADRLAEAAETAAESAADRSDSAAEDIGGSQKFSLSMLASSSAAQAASLDAGAQLASAVEAAEAADELDKQAAEALEAAEEMLALYYDQEGGASS